MSQIDLQNFTRSPAYQQELTAQRTFMARVYGWMTIGLLATAFTSLVVASSPAMMKTIFGTGLFWILIIAELGVAITMGMALRVLPVAVAGAMFVLYSVLNGATLAIILYAYTMSSVAATFFITAGMFAGMSVFGYVTGRNLSSLGSFCMMGLWGLILASIVNMFMGSMAMGWLISFVGVIVFTGLTAFHTQKIKQSYADNAEGSAAYQKSALIGAFSLYLDFINLFLYLLQFMGKARD